MGNPRGPYIDEASICKCIALTPLCCIFPLHSPRGGEVYHEEDSESIFSQTSSPKRQHDISMTFPTPRSKTSMETVTSCHMNPSNKQKNICQDPFLCCRGRGPSRPLSTYIPCRILTAWGSPYLQGAHFSPVYPKIIFVMVPLWPQRPMLNL